jgi:hypothetical protein
MFSQETNIFASSRNCENTINLAKNEIKIITL